MNRQHLFILSLSLFFTYCSSQEYLPKPKGYNRIDLAPNTYKALPDSFPFLFEYAQLARIQEDESYIKERFWFDLYYDDYDAFVQVTYKTINGSNKRLRAILRDSYELTSKHNEKAYAIDETVVKLNNGMFATMMELSGEVPSQFQFHMTDSINHFLRCALYFKTSTKNDSLQPVIDHIKKDMIHMASTLQWKK